MSWRRCSGLSEGKSTLFLDIPSQPVLVHRFGNHIDRLAENLPQAAGQGFEATKVGKAASSRFLAQTHDDIYIGIRPLLAPRN